MPTERLDLQREREEGGPQELLEALQAGVGEVVEASADTGGGRQASKPKTRDERHQPQP